MPSSARKWLGTLFTSLPRPPPSGKVSRLSGPPRGPSFSEQPLLLSRGGRKGQPRLVHLEQGPAGHSSVTEAEAKGADVCPGALSPSAGEAGAGRPREILNPVALGHRRPRWLAWLRTSAESRGGGPKPGPGLSGFLPSTPWGLGALPRLLPLPPSNHTPDLPTSLLTTSFRSGEASPTPSAQRTMKIQRSNCGVRSASRSASDPRLILVPKSKAQAPGLAWGDGCPLAVLSDSPYLVCCSWVSRQGWGELVCSLQQLTGALVLTAAAAQSQLGSSPPPGRSGHRAPVQAGAWSPVGSALGFSVERRSRSRVPITISFALCFPLTTLTGCRSPPERSWAWGAPE